ncbi:winged helix-turn-helix domain-containing protein [Streptomyces sp. NPDC096032]|uniref:AfsR/SARP family transcriptional regulator n=1 Tax=Streptomyces sp. NPDC096032 TaxID=3366070 RepID=UPI003827540F
MVLVQLLLARGAVVPTERIVERLWPHRVPPSAQASLHAYIARLRRTLEPERAPRTPARLLVSAPYGYSLTVERDAVDAWAFEDRGRFDGGTARPPRRRTPCPGARRLGRAAVRRVRGRAVDRG